VAMIAPVDTLKVQFLLFLFLEYGVPVTAT